LPIILDCRRLWRRPWREGVSRKFLREAMYRLAAQRRITDRPRADAILTEPLAQWLEQMIAK
jgi:GntR family L-lactate dehydrogenase operon transcriptional regulator